MRPKRPPSAGPVQRVLLEELIHAKAAATCPTATFNKTIWLIRHLTAPLCLEGIKRPARKAAKDGLVKELEQAPALPPGALLEIEKRCESMIRANTWDSVALCVAL